MRLNVVSVINTDDHPFLKGGTCIGFAGKNTITKTNERAALKLHQNLKGISKRVIQLFLWIRRQNMQTWLFGKQVDRVTYRQL